MGLAQKLGISKQIFYLALATAIRGLRDNLRYVLWQPFALSLGITMKSIGALESLMDLAKIVIQPVLGAASDAIGRKRFLVIRDFLIVVSGLCFLYARDWFLLAAGMILIGFSVALIPIYNATVAESADPKQLGWIYSLLGSSYMALGLVGTLSAGFLAEKYGYSSVYLLSTVFAVASLLVTFFKIEETLDPDDKMGFTLRDALSSFFDTFKPPRYLWGFYVAMSVDLFAFSVGWRLINGMLTDAFGVTPYQLGLFATVNAATMAVFQVILGRHVDRFGYVKFLVISQILSCIILGMLLVNQSFMFIFAANLIMGFSAAFWGPAEQAWIANNVNPDEMAKSMGGYSTFRGLIALPGPFIGGYLFDLFGYHIPVMVNLVIAIIDVGLLVFLVKDHVRPE
jgi:MFS family permease